MKPESDCGSSLGSSLIYNHFVYNTSYLRTHENERVGGKISKGAKIRNRYKSSTTPDPDTNGK